MGHSRHARALALHYLSDPVRRMRHRNAVGVGMSASQLHVIDDDERTRAAVVDLLIRGGYAVRGYASAEAFLGQDALPVCGCVITDVNMPAMSGLELLRHLKADGVALPVLLLTGAADVAMAVEALKGGAADFIEKPVRAEILLPAVAEALAVQAATMARARFREETSAQLASLSPRESEVLARVVAGDSNKEIARSLALSPRTVEAYRAKVMLKLDADSVPALVEKMLGAGAGDAVD